MRKFERNICWLKLFLVFLFFLGNEELFVLMRVSVRVDEINSVLSAIE